jgi:molybdopterin-guanine dinucleotide biosynthesis protein A
MYKDFTGIILSGGKSSRMGSDKALLTVGDETIIERITDLMKSIFCDVHIITNTPEDYKFLNIPLHEDILKNKGPLSGIHSGLHHSLTKENFFISCDLPIISKELIKYIVEFKSDKSIRYCIASGRQHYLAGVYSKNLIPEIEKIIKVSPKQSEKKEHKFSVKNLLMKIEAEIINVEHLSFYNDDLFFNLNTPEDFEVLKNISLNR